MQQTDGNKENRDYLVAAANTRSDYAWLLFNVCSCHESSKRISCQRRFQKANLESAMQLCGLTKTL